ncbi:hypothetical protein GQR58_029383 [Nymphon striatum]|nr:hypothetical protein GQR58_029383 [Nymphon striatum]
MAPTMAIIIPPPTPPDATLPKILDISMLPAASAAPVIFLIAAIFFCATISFGQIASTNAENVETALQLKNQLHTTSLVQNIPLKNIGPTVMSGRVVDVDVNPNNTIEFYVAYASGGLWYTNNNGTSFTPVLDTSETQNVGDIAVDWKSGSHLGGYGRK